MEPETTLISVATSMHELIATPSMNEIGTNTEFGSPTTDVSTSTEGLLESSLKKARSRIETKVGRRVQFMDPPKVGTFDPSEEEAANKNAKEKITPDEKEILEECKKAPIDHFFPSAPVALYQQLEVIENPNSYSRVIDLRSVVLTKNKYKAYETALKTIKYKEVWVNTNQVNDSDFLALLKLATMRELVIFEFDVRTLKWTNLFELAAESYALSTLSFKGIKKEQDLCVNLVDGLKDQLLIKAIKLDDCKNLTSLSSLMSLEVLTEVRLVRCKLALPHCESIKNALFANSELSLLDLSHNNICDSGLQEIVTAVYLHRQRDNGVQELILFDNHLSKLCFSSINLLLSGPQLRILNIGKNNLGDDFLQEIDGMMKSNTSVVGLSLENVGLATKSMLSLIDICLNNDTLLHLNLRKNNIKDDEMELFAQKIYKMSLIHCDFDPIDEPGEPFRSIVLMMRVLKHKRSIWNLVNEKDWEPEPAVLTPEPDLETTPKRVRTPPPLRPLSPSLTKLKTRFDVTKISEASTSLMQAQDVVEEEEVSEKSDF